MSEECIQLNLFEDQSINSQEYLWDLCFGWKGPVVGKFCQVDSVFATTEDGNQIYAYMEKCKVLKALSDDNWLVEIALEELTGRKWYKDGTRLILHKNDIWPPVGYV